ncbi:MAG: hypothetical protein VYE22_24310 [Myxococcota bacterium]|nr:hypothetical protein [Myxococcota bacterium]
MTAISPLTLIAPDNSKRIAALRVRCAEDGTHSILDIDRVGDQAGYGTAGPLAADELRALFGTLEPTRSQVTGAQDSLIGRRRRGMASHVVVLADGAPTGITFAGVSGD